MERTFRIWWRASALVVLGLGAVTSPVHAQPDPWLTKAHDARRTGQSTSNGPIAIDPDQSWTAEVPGAHTINVGASVTEGGVFFGSWGLLRRDPANPTDPRVWDKSDGQFYGLDINTGASLWGGPLDLDLVPRCYAFEDRGPNVLWCGLTPYEVSFYNGTVEGQATVDPGRNVLYVGRGDGRLYAIDPDEGRILWRFVTFNPELVADPDGGGEVVTSPLLGPDGTIYFGTWGEGAYETHAFYAVNADSTLQWRYPTDTSLTHRFFASPALSPDASTLYVSTFRDDDGTQPSTCYAFHREPTGPASDEVRLKWSLDLEHRGVPVHTTTLAVGSDGTLYLGGTLAEGAGVPVVLAVEDQGRQPALKWTESHVELRDGAQFVGGLALREVDGQTQRLYVTTANIRTLNAKEEGVLYAVDPGSGTVLASYDPSGDVPEAIGSLNSPAIGADGTVYFGVRGRYGDDPVKGQYIAVTYDEAAAQFNRLWNAEVDGLVEWNHPAIGPDGGIYAGSSSLDEQVRFATYDEGVTPEGTTAYFHALKGPTKTTAVEDEALPPSAFQLEAAFPNPFAATTTLAVEMTQPGAVHLQIFDVLGRSVRTLANGPQPAGRHTFVWDGRDRSGRRLAGGLYLVQMTVAAERAARAHTHVRKLVLMR